MTGFLLRHSHLRLLFDDAAVEDVDAAVGVPRVARVVGDHADGRAGAVQFSGAGWANANTLSGGAAPDAFKGFAPGRSPICVGDWSARPGQSATPPATVPAYTAVLVGIGTAFAGGRHAARVGKNMDVERKYLRK